MADRRAVLHVAREVTVNGRFLTQHVEGVQRFATEVLARLNAAAPTGEAAVAGGGIQVLCPAGASLQPRPPGAPALHRGRLHGHIWEQLELPLRAFGSTLVNLCNTAPLFKRAQIMTIHDAAVYAVPEAYTLAFRLWYRLIFAVAGRRAARIITVSEFSKRELIERAGLPSERIAVVAEGCDHILGVQPDERILDRFGLQQRRFVLAVGSLSPHKNLAAADRGVALARLEDVDFVVAGGANPGVFADRAASLPRSVKYVGRVSDGELRALYERAACFVFPSLYEGFGLPPLEAMACGCPVIASAAASIPEVCADAALYFDPRVPEELAAKLRQLLDDEPLRARLRKRGLERARQFTWDRCAAQVLSEIIAVHAGRQHQASAVARSRAEPRH